MGIKKAAEGVETLSWGLYVTLWKRVASIRIRKSDILNDKDHGMEGEGKDYVLRNSEFSLW